MNVKPGSMLVMLMPGVKIRLVLTNANVILDIFKSLARSHAQISMNVKLVFTPVATKKTAPIRAVHFNVFARMDIREKGKPLNVQMSTSVPCERTIVPSMQLVQTQAGHFNAHVIPAFPATTVADSVLI